jgi:hypothetical protein
MKTPTRKQIIDYYIWYFKSAAKTYKQMSKAAQYQLKIIKKAKEDLHDNRKRNDRQTKRNNRKNGKHNIKARRTTKPNMERSPKTKKSNRNTRNNN